jgi:hypothetical protein
LVGFEANITGGAYPTWNGYYKGSLFTKRDANIQYPLEEINGHIGINDMALVSTRCYVKSPFANEDALYYGGFDPDNIATNMAWIFKKDYQTTSINVLDDQKVNINIYPIAAVNYLNVELETNTCVHTKSYQF